MFSGRTFPADVRSFPEPHNLPKLISQEQVQECVLSVRAKGKYAAEAYSLDLVDTTGKLSTWIFSEALVLQYLIYVP